MPFACLFPSCPSRIAYRGRNIALAVRNPSAVYAAIKPEMADTVVEI